MQHVSYTVSFIKNRYVFFIRHFWPVKDLNDTQAQEILLRQPLQLLL